MGSNIVAFSGGKDSTAMVLRLAEIGEPFACLFTATGNELPEVRRHLDAIIARTGVDLIEPANHSLDFWIREHNALPNWRQRWCTRQIKIVPCIAYLKAHPGSTLLVGLRADEPEREGLYGEFASYRYPLREWGWGLADVNAYVAAQGVTIPRRTDCALCYGQRLGEWFELWRDHPEEFARGEAYEADVGHTFRSAQRDSWPAPLVQLRIAFEGGRVPKGVRAEDADGPESCRVCRL